MSSRRPRSTGVRRWLRLGVAVVLLPLPAVGVWALARRVAVPKHTVIVRNRTARPLPAVRADIAGQRSEAVRLAPGGDHVLEWRARGAGAYRVTEDGVPLGECGPGDSRRWVATVGPGDSWSCGPL